ncbi:hypothetical protein HPP92_026190, partial [Vanilla planifolia]
RTDKLILSKASEAGSGLFDVEARRDAPSLICAASWSPHMRFYILAGIDFSCCRDLAILAIFYRLLGGLLGGDFTGFFVLWFFAWDAAEERFASVTFGFVCLTYLGFCSIKQRPFCHIK